MCVYARTQVYIHRYVHVFMCAPVSPYAHVSGSSGHWSPHLQPSAVTSQRHRWLAATSCCPASLPGEPGRMQGAGQGEHRTFLLWINARPRRRDAVSRSACFPSSGSWIALIPTAHKHTHTHGCQHSSNILTAAPDICAAIARQQVVDGHIPEMSKSSMVLLLTILML